VSDQTLGMAGGWFVIPCCPTKRIRRACR